MSTTVDNKLQRAEDLEAKAEKLKTKDPQVAQQIKDYAHKVRTSAIRQMKRRPGKGRRGSRISAGTEGKEQDFGI